MTDMLTTSRILENTTLNKPGGWAGDGHFACEVVERVASVRRPRHSLIEAIDDALELASHHSYA
jgi:hypothetical protein